MTIELTSTGAAYIRYTASVSVDNIFVGDDETSDVIVDVARARAFAVERDLPFPSDPAAARNVSAA